MSGIFQNIDPPPPLHPASVSSPRTKGGGEEGVHTRRAVRGWRVNILEDARHWIGFLQYNISTIKSIELGPPTSRAFVFPEIFWGQNYVPVRPYVLIFSVFPYFYSFWFFSFCYSLLFLLFLSLLSLLVGTILRFLILLLLHFTVCCITC